MNFLLLLAELIGLFLVVRVATTKLFTFFLLLSGNRTLAVTLMTLILFPGTVIHELSHLFTAEILGVHTGKLTLVPENIRTEEIQTGSVQVSQTDPFRRAIVGFAPFTVGIAVLVILTYIISTNMTGTDVLSLFRDINIVTIIIFYLLFAIATSMFPSSPDIKGTPALLLTIALFVIAGYFVGVRINLTGQALDIVTRITDGLTQSLALVLAVNLILVLVLQLFIALISKITHRTVVKL